MPKRTVSIRKYGVQNNSVRYFGGPERRRCPFRTLSGINPRDSRSHLQLRSSDSISIFSKSLPKLGIPIMIQGVPRVPLDSGLVQAPGALV